MLNRLSVGLTSREFSAGEVASIVNLSKARKVSMISCEAAQKVNGICFSEELHKATGEYRTISASTALMTIDLKTGKREYIGGWLKKSIAFIGLALHAIPIVGPIVSAVVRAVLSLPIAIFQGIKKIYQHVKNGKGLFDSIKTTSQIEQRGKHAKYKIKLPATKNIDDFKPKPLPETTQQITQTLVQALPKSAQRSPTKTELAPVEKKPTVSAKNEPRIELTTLYQPPLPEATKTLRPF